MRGYESLDFVKTLDLNPSNGDLILAGRFRTFSSINFERHCFGQIVRYSPTNFNLLVPSVQTSWQEYYGGSKANPTLSITNTDKNWMFLAGNFEQFAILQRQHVVCQNTKEFISKMEFGNKSTRLLLLLWH